MAEAPAKEFSAEIKELGDKILGGCCGTTPKYIELLNAELR